MLKDEKTVNEEGVTEEGEKGVETECDGGGKDRVQLQRTVTLIGAISITVGGMIGSGIFISPTSVLRNTGSVGLCLVVWAIGGVMSMLGSLTVAELACRVPKHGGEYAYVREGIGNWLGALYTWNYLVIVAPSGLAVKSLTFARYLMPMVYAPCGDPELPVSITAVVLIVSLFLLNITSNRISVKFNVVFLFAKLIALAIIIIGGIVALITGNNRGASELESGFEGTTEDAATIAKSFYFVMYAYGGWAYSNMIVEEAKNPKRTIPLAAIIGVLIVTTVYILTNVSYLAVMSREEMLSSDTVAVTWGRAVWGSGAASYIISLCVIISTAGSANVGTFVAPRVVFAAARDGNIPDVLSYLHVNKKTPIPAIFIMISIAIVYASVSSIRSLITVLNVTQWAFYFLCSISLLVIRHRQRSDDHVPFKQPLPVIVLFMLTCVYLVIMPWTSGEDVIVLVYVLVFLIVGLILFFIFKCSMRRFRCFDGLVVCLQLFTETAPPVAYVATD